MTLHFAEISFAEPGKRTFGVVLEGKKVLEGYEPPLKAGAPVAEEKVFQVEVLDGFLDVEFLREREDPTVSAIAIERRTKE